MKGVFSFHFPVFFLTNEVFFYFFINTATSYVLHKDVNMVVLKGPRGR